MSKEQRARDILGDWFGAVSEPLSHGLQSYIRATTKRKLLAYCAQRNKRPDVVVDLSIMRFLLEEEARHE